MNNILHLTLPEIGDATVRIADEQLFGFAGRQFQNYLSGDGPFSKELDVADGDVVIALANPKLSDRVSTLLRGKRRLSRDIDISDGALQMIRQNRSMSLVHKLTANDLSLLWSCASRRRWGAGVLRAMRDGRHAMLHREFYDSVLFPLFGLYALWGRYYLVHGALFGIGKESVILAGLDGVGKSSLAAALIEKGYCPLSDNFTLFNGQSAVGISMPMRFAADDIVPLPVVYRDKKIKECLSDAASHDAVPVTAVVLLCISERLRCHLMGSFAYGVPLALISGAAGEVAEANAHCAACHYLNALAGVDGAATPGLRTQYYLLEVPRGLVAEGAEELLCKFAT